MTLCFRGVSYLKLGRVCRQITGITDLTPALAVKRRPVQDNDNLIALFSALTRLSILEKTADGRLCLKLGVPKKLGFAIHSNHIVVINLESTTLLRSLTLLLHRNFVALDIKFKTSLSGNIVSQINGEAIGVI